jgi:uncharacterized protein (TIGR02271 family)
MTERDPSHPPSRMNDDAQEFDIDQLGPDEERVLELREEQLAARKEIREVGEIVIRTEFESLPAQIEVEAVREEVEVEHEPVGQAVNQRDAPWEENGVLVVPVYEEQLVVSKRLILRERLRIRRVGTTERQLFQDTLRREHLVVEDPQQTGLVREIYPTQEAVTNDASPRSDGSPPSKDADLSDRPQGGFLEGLVRKALE